MKGNFLTYLVRTIMTLSPLNENHLTDYQGAKKDKDHRQVHPFVALVDVVHLDMLVPVVTR